ncbi:NIL domain-containing protein [Chloroflexota bacterium]
MERWCETAIFHYTKLIPRKIKGAKMVKRQMMFTFPEKLIKEPIIFNLGQQFNVMTNIRRADVSEDKGWVVLELEGEEKEIDQGITWVMSKGVRVDPVIGDIVEG